MKRKVVIAVFCLWAGAWLWLVWPTPWRYETEYWESMLQPDYRRVPVQVRIHRLTGEKQDRATGEEWGHHVW